MLNRTNTVLLIHQTLVIVFSTVSELLVLFGPLQEICYPVNSPLLSQSRIC